MATQIFAGKGKHTYAKAEIDGYLESMVPVPGSHPNFTGSFLSQV